MITTANAKKLYASQVSFVELDAEALNTAKKRFNEYQKQKVIKDNCLFSDNIWKATDEYESTGIYFDINTFNYSRWEKVFCMNKLDFILKAKTFVIDYSAFHYTISPTKGNHHSVLMETVIPV